MKIKPLKPKKCRACGNKFKPWNSLQTCCSPLCAIEYDKQKKAKKAAKEHTQNKREFRLKDLPLQKKVTQAHINRAAKLWDIMNGYGCISCGKKGGATFGGHYLSVGSNPNMRFNFKNISLQCFSCNGPMGSNAINYRLGLVERYGEQFVNDLESDKDPRQFTLEEVILIGKYYKALCRRMVAENSRELTSWQ